MGSGYRCEPEGEAGASQSQELEGKSDWQGHVRQLSLDRRRRGLERPTGPRPDTGSPSATQREWTPLRAGGAGEGPGTAWWELPICVLPDIHSRWKCVTLPLGLS